MRIQIYLNQNTRDSFIKGYAEGDPLTLICDAEMKEGWTLEKIYEANQHSDDTDPWYRGRSLSKGDVIVVDDEAYAVATVGFERVLIPELQDASV